MSIELRQYHTENGVKIAFVKFGGPKWLHVMIMDGPLTVRKVPKSDERLMREVRLKNRPYPKSRAIRHFRKFGKSHGITKNAKRFLTEASK